MVYMTFNSSCSYAGVANMLARHGVTTDDRTIAMGMKLPYLFAYEDGTYIAGPMLQSAEWFNMYLNSIGFRMTETAVPAEQAADYLRHLETAMLGMKLETGGKHAVVYIGNDGGKLLFLNNKRQDDPSPEQLALSEDELTELIEPSCMIATLERIAPKSIDLSEKLRASISVLRKNFLEIQEVCSEEKSVGSLRSMLNTLFRPLLLDGITMLRLIDETELAQQFASVQRSFLTALQQDDDTVITLGDHLSMEDFSAAVEGYVELISAELSRS